MNAAAMAFHGMKVSGRERGWDEERIRTQNVEIETGNRYVQVCGVQSRPELNGTRVKLIRFLGSRQRYEVKETGRSKLLALKPQCLEFRTKAEAIHRAVERNDHEGLEQLLSAGPSAIEALKQEVETPHGRMPILGWAAGTGRYMSVALLAHWGADVHARASLSGSTALHFASTGGQPECVAALIDHDCDVNVRARESTQATPLMMAASQGRAEVVNILLSCPGIDLEVTGPEQATAFLLAAGTDGFPLHDTSGGPDFISDHSRCLSLLAKAGCNTEATDSHGNTATTIASRMHCIATQQELSKINKRRAQQRAADAKPEPEPEPALKTQSDRVTVTDALLEQHIAEMASSSDFELLSLKMIRDRLADRLGKDMSPYKKQIKALVIKKISEDPLDAATTADDVPSADCLRMERVASFRGDGAVVVGKQQQPHDDNVLSKLFDDEDLLRLCLTFLTPWDFAQIGLSVCKSWANIARTVLRKKVLRPGCEVVVTGLAGENAELNGMIGRIVVPSDEKQRTRLAESGRLKIRIGPIGHSAYDYSSLGKFSDPDSRSDLVENDNTRIARHGAFGYDDGQLQSRAKNIRLRNIYPKMSHGASGSRSFVGSGPPELEVEVRDAINEQEVFCSGDSFCPLTTALGNVDEEGVPRVHPMMRSRSPTCISKAELVDRLSTQCKSDGWLVRCHRCEASDRDRYCALNVPLDPLDESKIDGLYRMPFECENCAISGTIERMKNDRRCDTALMQQPTCTAGLYPIVIEGSTFSKNTPRRHAPHGLLGPMQVAVRVFLSGDSPRTARCVDSDMWRHSLPSNIRPLNQDQWRNEGMHAIETVPVGDREWKMVDVHLEYIIARGKGKISATAALRDI